MRGGGDLASAVSQEVADHGPQVLVLVILYEQRIVGAIQWSEEEDPDYRHASIDIYLDPQFTVWVWEPTPFVPWPGI